MSSADGGVLGRSGRHDRNRARQRAAADIRRRTVGASFGGFPMANVMVLELGIAAALVVLSTAAGLRVVAALVVLSALAIGVIRWHGRWVPQWLVVIGRFLVRKRSRVASPAPSVAEPAETASGAASTVTGPEDARVSLLRLLVDDLVVVNTTTRDQQPIGLAWHKGAWTAALLVDPVPAMVSPVGARTDVPLAALADCLEDRGVVLDAIGIIWHSYPGSSRLPVGSAAVAAYNEVLGPLPAVAQRSTWVTVRLDARRCPSAVRERGGGVAGAHRALLGAVSRVQGTLDLAGLNTRVLSGDGLLRAAVSSAELAATVGRADQVELTEHWSGVRSGGIEHASYGIMGWPPDAGRLDALASIRALSTTVSLALTPGAEDGKVGLRGVVRVSARTPAELVAADARIGALGTTSEIRLARLNGQQAAALAMTLPVGGTA